MQTKSTTCACVCVHSATTPAGTRGGVVSSGMLLMHIEPHRGNIYPHARRLMHTRNASRDVRVVALPNLQQHVLNCADTHTRAALPFLQASSSRGGLLHGLELAASDRGTLPHRSPPPPRLQQPPPTSSIVTGSSPGKYSTMHMHIDRCVHSTTTKDTFLTRPHGIHARAFPTITHDCANHGRRVTCTARAH